MEKIKVAFHTLGCKLNFSETATIARSFNYNYQQVPFGEVAHIYVINTCSVTQNADKEFKQIVRSALSRNKEAFIIATGCYAQLKPEELANIEGVDLVLGAKEKFNIPYYIGDLSKRGVAEVHSCEIEQVNFYQGSYSLGDRTRAFLKVQDGCDYKCTYCTIPRARGISRSDTLENILKNVSDITSKGIKEIVLTGVNVGDYGKGEFGNKKHQHTFLSLLQSLDISEVQRIRISSIEPNLLTDEIIEFIAHSKRFVPHFHIPLQSGNNVILKKMKRRYLRELYLDKVNLIRSLMPDASIGADVIVGFPGEEQEHFLDTYHFIRELQVSYLHVFTYSERDHTEAITFEKSVPKEIRHKRNKMLRGLSAKKQFLFYESQLGKQKEVLFEKENKEGFSYGYSDNYIRVKIPFKEGNQNSLKRVYLEKIHYDGTVLARECNLENEEFTKEEVSKKNMA